MKKLNKYLKKLTRRRIDRLLFIDWKKELKELTEEDKKYIHDRIDEVFKNDRKEVTKNDD